MKIKVNDNDGTVRFINEHPTELFALGKMAERLQGQASSIQSTEQQVKELIVQKENLLRFLTK